MKARIDFSLSNRFGAVEQCVFRLVLAGVCDVQTIRILMSLYSDEVLANAIKKLVNYQMLCANVEARTIGLSDPILALMESCLQYSGTLILPDGLADDSEKIYISDVETKQQILKALLPGIKTGFLVKSMDFVLYHRGDQDE